MAAVCLQVTVNKQHISAVTVCSAVEQHGILYSQLFPGAVGSCVQSHGVGAVVTVQNGQCRGSVCNSRCYVHVEFTAAGSFTKGSADHKAMTSCS